MNGFTLTASAVINAVTDMAWTIAAAGDYGGDGKADILWRNVSTGESIIWLMDGFALLSSGFTQAPPTLSLFYAHVDHLNTPRLVANQAGTAVWRWDQQEPFGVNAPDENPSGLGAFDLPLRLPGQYYDKETNLHYNFFRDYDPSLGRYGESDPIGLKGGINSYLYAFAKPVQRTDRLGLDACAPSHQETNDDPRPQLAYQQCITILHIS